MNDVVKVSSLKGNSKPIDPDVKVPAAVARAAAAATAAQAAAYPGQTADPATTPAPSGDTIVIADPAAPVTPPGNPAPAPEPAPVAPQTSATPPADGNDETWEQRFRSSEGRRVKAERLLEQTTNRLGALENMVADMQAQRAAAPAPTPAPTPSRLVSEQEENEFGTEMLDVMGRRAREIVAPELTTLRAELDRLKGTIEGTATAVTRNARQEMLTTMDRELPNWREVNNLAEFKAWLALPDPYFGVTRNPELQKAFEQNDTPRVLAFFKGFVSELAATTPAGDTLTIEPAAPQPARPSLETLAAPGRARTSAQTPAPTEKPIITTADINAFFDAVRKGAYRGREDLQRQLEQELFDAQKEGRVRAV